MSPLDRKLFRDLRRIRGQAGAIAAVIALGVMMMVMMSGLVNTLDETRQAYYDRYRLADVFAPLTRAPARMVARIAALPGVETAVGRVVGSALFDTPKGELPIRARALSLPDPDQMRLNAVYLTAGQWPAQGSENEVLLLEGFAKARGLEPGDGFTATLNGVKRGFRITGLAQSPEFLYTTPPGEMVPDDARFAVFWLPRAAMAALYDMDGAFNEALVALRPGAAEPPVRLAIDKLLDPFGGTGAYGRADHPSNRFVSEEINGLRTSATSVPPIFLAIAAFLLYIVISRMVQAEREQIGLLKAFGYSGLEVSLHYLKLVLTIAFAGALLGAVAGIAAGNGMAVMYQTYFKFPFLVFSVDPASFVIGFAVAILAASGGSLLVLRRVFRLTPAVAMRPPTPPDYSRTLDLAHLMRRWLDQPSRMVLRRITRYPGRMFGAVIGVAAGMALSVSTLSMMEGFNTTVDLSFSVMDRSDMAVSFALPRGEDAVLSLRRTPGVLSAEPVRIVPAILRNGPHIYRGSIEGREPHPRLNRVIDHNARPIDMPPAGVILAQPLADILHLKPGDTLIVEVREGRRPVLRIPVAGIAQTLLGAPAFMSRAALNRALKEPGRVSGAFLTVDQAQADRVAARIKDMPAVAGVSRKDDQRAALIELMNTGPGSVRFIMLAVAATITFGIIYNAARIALAERARDIASLRVMGFGKGEAAFVLLGELGFVILMALPLGLGLGQGLTYLIVVGFSTDIYQIPVVHDPAAHGMAALAVLAAALLSGWLVKRDMDRADLIAALKTRD
ncbi:FtsX-like permease family protein [Mesobacterium sp. TK19101]|uniref:FtsX-like permease family protein n=1 Tax=Mesobacterium hydrothermale TaxID=3111907 RepID=A0ABU6HJ84_9RHOB|nr:FtsX-like permease family protein [Mesobacterium sp. TK19101]MEC3862514.1 FtsX-like permease family protein [Mesobacterium sp. TK19101]